MLSPVMILFLGCSLEKFQRKQKINLPGSYHVCKVQICLNVKNGPFVRRKLGAPTSM